MKKASVQWLSSRQLSLLFHLVLLNGSVVGSAAWTHSGLLPSVRSVGTETGRRARSHSRILKSDWVATAKRRNASGRLRSMASSTASSSSASSADNMNNENIDDELASGRILEGGKVIDFSSVKASDRAEQALVDARKLLNNQNNNNNINGAVNGDHHHHHQQPFFVEPKQQQEQQQQPTTRQQEKILGINQEVIDEVGHDLGNFATAEQVQACAAYIRSQAPAGLFQKKRRPEEEGKSSSSGERDAPASSFSAEEVQRYKDMLFKAYYESGEVTGAFAKTFYMGTMLLPLEARKAIWAVYVWCRRTDEIVDAPRDNDDDMMLDLSSWEVRLENLFRYGEVHDIFDLALLHVRVQYPTLDITPFMDMIRGMLMDVPGLGQDRYEKFDELHLYCYRVAGTVGLMSLPVFGCAPGYDDDIAREPALSLGVAFQLTNILRDVGEDAVQRGRVYLPQEDLRRFGVTEEQIYEQRVDENYVALMKFEIARARMYYERARRGVFMLAESSRLPVQSSLDAYGRILDKIEENGYDSLTKRAYVDKWEKLSIIPSSWYRTLDISRSVPLPGDEAVPSLVEVDADGSEAP